MMLQQIPYELKDVRNWTNDGSSIPDWVRRQISGEPAANGTFLIATPVGTARVHSGDVVIEYQGQLWSRSPDEVPQLIAGFGAEAALPISAIGPGKDAQFGTKSKAGHGRKRGGERKTGFRQPIGKMPSIEWVHTTELTVDQSYQRSIANEGSRRLIASIAANFDWRLCAPACCLATLTVVFESEIFYVNKFNALAVPGIIEWGVAESAEVGGFGADFTETRRLRALWVSLRDKPQR